MSEQESDDILARLRAANPVLVDEERGRAAVAQLALTRILEDPAAPTDRPADGRGKRRARGRLGAIPLPAAITSHLALAAFVAVTVVVAVGGILLLGRGRQPQVEAGSPPQYLLRTLGILRTAPTATDRALAACVERSARQSDHPPDNCLRATPPGVFIAEHPAAFPPGIAGSDHPKFDLALIRSVPMAGSADRVTIFPVSWRSSRPSAPRTWGVVVNLVDNNLEVLDVNPTSVGTLRAHGIVLLPDVANVSGLLTGLTVHDGAIIVPDGVAKVTVRMAMPATGSVTSANAGYGPPVLENVTAVVHDNVATVPLRTPAFTAGFGFGDGSRLRMTWLDAHGKVIKHTTTAFALADFGPAAT